MKINCSLAVSLTFLIAGCGGGTSGGSPTAILPPQTSQLVSTKTFTVKGSGSAPVVTMIRITVPGLPSTGGVTVTKDGAVWWSSLLGFTSGQMVRLSPGFSVKTVPFGGPSAFGALPDRTMASTPNGLAFGTFDGTDPTHGFGFLEIVAAASSSSATSPPADLPGGVPLLSLVGTPFLATGPDGNVWYVTQHGAPRGVLVAGGIGVVSATTGENFFTPTPKVSDFLTAVGVGPDNRLWAGGRINDATTEGFYRYSTGLHLLGAVPISNRILEIDAEVTGPDHALWFTDARQNLVARLTATGVLTTFPLPTSGAKPLDITVGGDGALWFTENGAGRVGRITTSGSISEYLLPPGDTTPVQITGPVTSAGCGNAQLWVASNGDIIELIITP